MVRTIKEVQPEMKPWRLIYISLFILVGLLAGFEMPAGAAVAVDISPAELSLHPGKTYDSFVVVTNTGEQPVRVKAYLADWRAPDGSDQYLDVGEEPRGLSRWMRCSPAVLTVPPGDSAKVYYEITIPDDHSLAGSYWGMLFVEGEARPVSVRTDQPERPTIGINVVLRHGIKMYVTVPGTEIRQAAFTNITVSPVRGGMDITATMANQGNIYLRPHIWMELHDRTGMLVYSEVHQLKTVLPQSKHNFNFELRDVNLAPGNYTALVIADYDAPSLIAAQADITIKEY